MASSLIALASAGKPAILFKHVIPDELFVGWDKCVYQKVTETTCHRIQDQYGILSASPNVKYAPDARVLGIMLESFKIEI